MRVMSHSQSRIITALSLLLLMIAPNIALAKDSTTAAYDFVQVWNKTYGIDHERAAKMMTAHHRGGMSEAEWVKTYSSFLEYVKYKHLGGELISTKEEKLKAQVILKSSVDSIQGPVVQYEIYDLVKIDGSWLIDFINIQDENLKTVIGPEPTQQIKSKINKPVPDHTPSE